MNAAVQTCRYKLFDGVQAVSWDQCKFFTGKVSSANTHEYKCLERDQTLIEPELIEVVPLSSRVMRKAWDSPKEMDATLKRHVIVFRLPENEQFKSQIRRIVIEKNDDVLMTGVEVGTLTRLVLSAVLYMHISTK